MDLHHDFRWLFLVATACLWSGIIVAAGSAQEHDATKTSPHTVTIRQFQYQPATITVHTGDTVVWINKDIVPHTVSDADGGFDSGEFGPDKSWKMVAKKPGTYHYGCSLHPNMQSMLIVQ